MWAYAPGLLEATIHTRFQLLKRRTRSYGKMPAAGSSDAVAPRPWPQLS